MSELDSTVLKTDLRRKEALGGGSRHNFALCPLSLTSLGSIHPGRQQTVACLEFLSYVHVLRMLGVCFPP